MNSLGLMAQGLTAVEDGKLRVGLNQKTQGVGSSAGRGFSGTCEFWELEAGGPGAAVKGGGIPGELQGEGCLEEVWLKRAGRGA